MYTKADLQLLYVAESERPYVDQVDRLINSMVKTVIKAAQDGKTRVDNFNVMLPEIPCRMLRRELGKRFPDSQVGSTTGEDSRLTMFYVDWS
jgi:hypothetical protein